MTLIHPGIVTKLCLWSLLVSANIIGRKFIIRKYDGVEAIVGVKKNMSNKSKAPCRKIWIALYWLGPLFNTLIMVLLMYIVDTEPEEMQKIIKLMQNEFKDLKERVSNILSSNIPEEWYFKLSEFKGNITQLIDNYATTKLAFFLLLGYFIISFVIEANR
ncbi:hypothetical protein, no similarity [Maudiozyma barnettii]|uniref:Uncharacterized protein n=1 Tax=Maudiozyma barnettii TaxID=61262 RepID=A0A8H2ZKC1_9SACH|nr:hypothetical protein, no similarity [Kazachstania barnettii]CAB4256818.1 hypothetical protein, no similarity [Kazachstania barnettii]CAD1785472.1 hypothetical protein, no similarity [Kazachstania barnettii]